MDIEPAILHYDGNVDSMFMPRMYRRPVGRTGAVLIIELVVEGDDSINLTADWDIFQADMIDLC